MILLVILLENNYRTVCEKLKSLKENEHREGQYTKLERQKKDLEETISRLQERNRRSVGKRKAEFEIAVSKQRRRGGSFEKANRANGKSGKECGDFYYG